VRFVSAVLALLVAVHAAPARAAPEPGAPVAADAVAEPAAEVAAYQTAVDRGTVAFRAGRYLEARTAFELAYSIHPDPVLLFNIASCWRRLGDDAQAIATYRAFLASAPAADERRRLAQATIRRLENERTVVDTTPLPPRRKRWTLTAKVGFGLGVAGAIGLVAAGIEAHRASSRQDELEALPMGTPWDRQQAQRYRDGEESSKRARIYASAGAALFVAGTALVLVGGRDEEVGALRITTKSGGLQLNLRRRF
jgi:tetratricopeptide (TPR) repeat protein